MFLALPVDVLVATACMHGTTTPPLDLDPDQSKLEAPGWRRSRKLEGEGSGNIFSE